MKRALLTSSLVFSLLSLSGCGEKFHARTPTVTGTKSDSAKLQDTDADLDLGGPMEYPARWDGKNPDAVKWTRATVIAIERYGQKMLDASPSDVASYCPRFPTMGREQKIAFWVHIISAIAEKESNFDPTMSYTETFVNTKGERVVSRGLLQLSLESANLYGCGFATEHDLENPSENLACGVKILNHWVSRESVISSDDESRWHGAARYWGVLRTSGTRDHISSSTSELPMCQVSI